jgi:hypothetical protein
MTGSGLFDFLIEIVCLIIIGALIFTAIDFITADARFKKIAKLAVGGVLLLMFLVSVKGVLFGGGGAGAITVMGLIYFAIGVIVALVVWIIIDKVLPVLAGWFPPMAPALDIIRIVISAIILIVLLLMAANLLFGGGGVGFLSGQHRSLLLDR